MKDFTSIMSNINTICDNNEINYIVTPFDLNSKKCHAEILKDGILLYPSGRVKNFSNHRPWHNHN